MALKTIQRWLSPITYSFSVQLVVLQLRNHLLFTMVWLLLGLMVSGAIASYFGAHYLFLSPEYMGRVSWLSYALVGASIGAVNMSWNLSMYLLSAERFPFLASLRRPLTKFWINNSIIPLIFWIVYIIALAKFAFVQGNMNGSDFVRALMGLFGGFFIFNLFVAGYFYITNRDIINLVKREHLPPDMSPGIIPPFRINRLNKVKTKGRTWYVDNYLGIDLKPRAVRNVDHYDLRLLLRVFRQNHFNALFFQIMGMFVLLGFGYMMDNPIFRIPAGASFMLSISIFIAITGAIAYWFDNWQVLAWIVIIFGVNFITSQDFLSRNNRAFGMDYEPTPVVLNNYEIGKYLSDSIVEADLQNTINILNNWKKKQSVAKPKLILVSASGGGLKSTVWAMQALRTLDSLSDSKFFNQTALYTGASGGMLGTAYYRELQLRAQTDSTIIPTNPEYLQNIGKDMLNSIWFSIVSNDLFLPLQKIEINNKQYVKDRGYMLELTYNENTDYLLNKTLFSYHQPEAKANIPMMMLTPVVINDGRKLYISPHGLSYMQVSNQELYNNGDIEPDGIDFRHFFQGHEADSLRFTTALRMNASYPFVLPFVHLPSSPQIEVVDAGFRDNFGLASTFRFVDKIEDWILENTSGVAIVQITVWDKFKTLEVGTRPGMIESIFKPLSILGEVTAMQDLERDVNYGYLSSIIGDEEVEIIRLQYSPSSKFSEASMSFHLTEREKQDIYRAIDSPANQLAVQRILSILNGNDL